eukprot:COSAG05_NODE_1687_length_4280_cov_15.580244_2_plen_135_part_00
MPIRIFSDFCLEIAMQALSLARSRIGGLGARSVGFHPLLHCPATPTPHTMAATPPESLVDCSKVFVKNDAYGGAGAFAACDIAKGDMVEKGIVRVLTNIDGNENPCESCHPPAVNVGRLHVALTPPRGRRLHVV